MPAPKNPNTVDATASRLLIGDRTATNRLTGRGYIVIPPGAIDGIVVSGNGDDCGSFTGCLECDNPNVGTYQYGTPLQHIVSDALTHTCSE